MGLNEIQGAPVMGFNAAVDIGVVPGVKTEPETGILHHSNDLILCFY
jgi:hypothetical protein